VLIAILFAVLRSLPKQVDKEVKLMEKISNGDQNAFSQLYDDYQQLLFRLILKIVKDEETANDVLQEVFVLIWSKAKGYNRSKGTPFGWITTLARNKAIDKIRSADYRKEKETINDEEDFILPNIESYNQDPLAATMASQRSKWMTKALDLIPVEQKQLLVDAYFQGYTQSELAKLHDLPLGTVKARMRQGMIKLMNILSDYKDKI